MSAPRASTGRFVAGLVGLFLCSTMAWLLLWAAGSSVLHGSAPVLVASGSMGPSVRAGDLVVLEPFHSQELAPGMVVRFEDPEGRGSILHRVVEVAADGSITTKGDANAVVDSSALEAGRITGVGRVLVPRAALPVLWWRTGEWLALAVFVLVTVTAVGVTRYALLDAYDPWRVEPEPEPARPPLPVAAREAIDRFRDEVARDGPVLVSRRLVLRRGAELAALGLAGAFLASSRTAWATFTDTTANGANTFGASTLTGPTGLTLAGAGCNGASGIVLQGSSTVANTANGATVTVPVPTGGAVGDLLLAQVGFHTHNFVGTITAPAGWTTVRVDADNAHTIQGVFWKVRTASEPASYTFTNTTGDTGRTGTGAIAVYSGIDTVNPIDAHGGNVYPANTSSLTAPSITTTVAGTRLLTLVGQRSNGPIAPPAAMVERHEVSASNEDVIEMADQSFAGPGPTGTRTATSGTSRSGIAQAVALRPKQIATLGSGATGSAPNGATGTITLSRPAGVQAGDVLIAHVVLHTHSFDPDPLAAPSGWTLVRVDSDNAHVTSGVFRRVAGASEPSSYTFTNNSGDTSQQAVGAVMAYRGVDTVNPIDASAGSGAVTGADTVVAPSVTTSRSGARLLSLVGVYGNAQGPAAPPGSMTERYEATEVSESAVIEILGEAADEVIAVAGSTGTRSTAVPATDTSVAQSVALRPYTAEPYADLGWTPSSSPSVDGYIIERRIGAVLDATATVTPGNASSYTDGPLVPGTTYTYRVIATAGTWRSAPATTTFTPTAC